MYHTILTVSGAMMDMTFDPRGGSYGLQTAEAAASARNVVVVVVMVAG